jgi:serine/threonine protein kinase
MSEVSDLGFHPGERIGNYRIDRALGLTGSGILLQAHHVVLPREAVLKVVHPAFAEVQLFVLQTLREACILEAIAHPGVPIVYESGVLKDRRPWFAFEAISGPTLEERLAAGPISVVEIARLIRNLAEIFEHAHRRGVIHRGLRPARVVITQQRRYPLCIPDWSEAVAHDATSHLPHSVPEGSGTYVAPELAQQVSGAGHEIVDDRCDMFALGAIACRALTGSDAAPHLALQTARAELPRELLVLVDSLLAANRYDRPSASEVRAEIDSLLPPIATAAQRNDVVVRDPPRTRRSRWTPDIHHVEATDVDIKIIENDRVK